MSDNVTSSDKASQPQFTIQAFYLRHASLETGLSPRALRSGVTPEMKLELRVQVNPLEKEDEVVLDLVITARDGSSLLYLIKLHQAGCFTLTHFTPEQKTFFLHTTCASLIYPYACHKANTLATDAGFPPINLLPIDFGYLYTQQQQQQASQNSSSDGTTNSSVSSLSSAEESKESKWTNFADFPAQKEETH